MEEQSTEEWSKKKKQKCGHLKPTTFELSNPQKLLVSNTTEVKSNIRGKFIYPTRGL